MKTALIVITGILIIATVSCEKNDLKTDVPECIELLVDNFRESDEGCKGASVWKYYQVDKNVYLFTPGECDNDGLIRLYDSECNELCTWDINDGYIGLCSMSPFALYNRDDGELVWESK